MSPYAGPPLGIRVRGYRVDRVLAYEEALDAWACSDNVFGVFYLQRRNGAWCLYAEDIR